MKDAVFFNTFNNVNPNYYTFKITVVSTTYTIGLF